MQRTFREIMFLQDLNNHENIIRYAAALLTLVQVGTACSRLRGSKTTTSQLFSTLLGEQQRFNAPACGAHHMQLWALFCPVLCGQQALGQLKVTSISTSPVQTVSFRPQHHISCTSVSCMQAAECPAC
jgi:hypothetical protein